jgi:glycosyltransferase involved in cell wall biosynthesis
MPCFNAAHYIGDSIGTALAQDYDGPLEVIVVDDGSSDESVRIASSFDRVRVLKQPNQGPGAARNLALREARGELIAFLDADDHWLPGSLRSRVAALQLDPEAGAVFAGFTRWTPSADPQHPDDEHVDRLPAAVVEAAASGWLYPAILLDPIVHIITLVVRRTVLNEVGTFDPALRTGEDYDLILRIAQHFRFVQVDCIAARYRLHPASTTRVPRAINNEYEVARRALARYGNRSPHAAAIDHGLLARRMHRMCFNHAYGHFWAGDAAVARHHFWRALRHHPLGLQAWVYALLSTAKAALPGPQRSKRRAA